MLNYVIGGGFTVKRIISYSALSAVTGLGTGKCLRNLQEHPGTGHRIIVYSILGGAVGGAIGVGVGLWAGRGTGILFMSQTMTGSLMTACYCNIHSAMRNSHLTLPTKETPLNDVTISSLSGVMTGSLFGLLPGARVFHMGMLGLVFGFIGHFVNARLRILRLEFLIRENYPELYAEVRASDKWIEDQMITNPYYLGPVNDRPPLMVWLESLWGDFGKRDPEELRARFQS